MMESHKTPTTEAGLRKIIERNIEFLREDNELIRKDTELIRKQNEILREQNEKLKSLLDTE